MKFKEFMKALDGALKHVYLLSGEETFYIDKAREKILSKLQTTRENLIVLDCSEKIPLADVISTIDTAPFFIPQNVVLVKNAPYFSAESKADRLEPILQNMLDTNYVIFVAKSIDKRKKLYKIIDKVGAILEAEPLRPWQIDDWLNDKLKSIGKNMYTEARRYFSERVAILPEISLWYLENEFDKIALNVAGKEITVADLQKNLLEPPEVSNFAVTDAIDAKRPKAAVKILRTQIRGDKTFMIALSVLINHVRKLIRGKYFLKCGIRGDNFAKKLEMHPYIAQKFEKTVASYPEKVLENIYLELADADFNLKTGRAGEETLERIVIKLCLRSS